MYPHERSLVEQMKDRPFGIVGVNSDRDLEKIRQRVTEEEITWRSFWNGPEGTRGPISLRWNVRGWPTVFVIDHEGIIRHQSHGGSEMDRAIQEWVKAAEEGTEDSGD